MNTPTLALSIRGPWWWLILHAGKDIENRSWRLPERMIGKRIFVHASKGITLFEYQAARNFAYAACARLGRLCPAFPTLAWFKANGGGIVGEITLTGCVGYSPSPWFVGEYGFTLADPKSLPFVPCRGMLGFFEPQLTEVAA